MTLKKRIEFAFLFLGSIFCLFYFAQNKDYFFPKPIKRQNIGIVSFSPSATEILFALGAKDIVGVCTSCTHPQDTEKINKIGEADTPNLAVIDNLLPRYAYVDEPIGKTLSDEMVKRGVTVIGVSRPSTVEDMLFLINTVAATSGTNAQALSQEMKNIAGLRQRPKAKVFIDTDGNLTTLGYLSFANDVLSRSGLKNIFDNVGEDSFKTNWDTVVLKNPDVILSFSPETSNYSALPNAQEVNAVKFHRVYKIEDPSLLYSPVPRTIKNIAFLRTLADDIPQAEAAPQQ